LLNAQRQSDISNLKTELGSHKDFKIVTTFDVQAQEKRVASLTKSCDDCTSKIEALTNDIKILKDKLSIVQQIEESDDVSDLKKQLSDICDLERKLGLI